jgi:predicted nucleic acid-binding protein
MAGPPHSHAKPSKIVSALSIEAKCTVLLTEDLQAGRRFGRAAS